MGFRVPRHQESGNSTLLSNPAGVISVILYHCYVDFEFY
jgi:hypothetical protein